MYIKTIKLEKAALKAFRTDPLTDSDDDFAEEPTSFVSKVMSYLPGTSNALVGDDEPADFEGGNRSRDIEMTGSKGRRKKN